MVDERAQVSPWLLKLVLGLAVLGFVLIEVGAVVVNRLQASDIASQAATEAGLVYFNSRSVDQARQRAAEFVEENEAEFVAFELDPRQEEISVTVSKTAGAFVLDEIDALDDLVTVTVTETVPLRR